MLLLLVPLPLSKDLERILPPRFGLLDQAEHPLLVLGVSLDGGFAVRADAGGQFRSTARSAGGDVCRGEGGEEGGREGEGEEEWLAMNIDRLEFRKRERYQEEQTRVERG